MLYVTWQLLTLQLWPRGQSCTVNNCHVAKTKPYQQKSRAKDVFQIFFFCRDVIQTFFLQGRKSKHAQIIRTKIIFKPNRNNRQGNKQYSEFVNLVRCNVTYSGGYQARRKSTSVVRIQKLSANHDFHFMT